MRIDLQAIVVGAVKTAGGTVQRIKMNKHIKVFWSLNGRPVITVFPKTTGDQRAVQNTLACVRRQIRAAGGVDGQVQ